MQKSELEVRARSLVNEFGLEFLPDSSDSIYSLDTATQEGYVQFCRQTRCRIGRYGRASIAGRAVYAYGGFGVVTGDNDALSVSAAANNTTPFVLVAGQPVSDYTELFRVSVTLTNGTASVANGNTCIVTVTGTGRGAVPQSEEITFDASIAAPGGVKSVAAGGSVTLNTTLLFESVVSVKPSVAQPSSWTHSAGVAEVTHGARIFEPIAVEFNGNDLDAITVACLSESDSNWRNAASGTPTVWVPDSEGMMRIHVPPSSAGKIVLEGYETPDLLTFSKGWHVPEIHESAQALISVWAAILVTVRDATQEQQLRASTLYPMWQDGISAEVRRIHGAPSPSVEVGKHAGYGHRAADRAAHSL